MCAAFAQQFVLAIAITQRQGMEAAARNICDGCANLAVLAAQKHEVITRGRTIAQDFNRQRGFYVAGTLGQSMNSQPRSLPSI